MVSRSILLRLSPREAEKKHKLQHCELIGQDKRKEDECRVLSGGERPYSDKEYKKANENKTAFVVYIAGVNARID